MASPKPSYSAKILVVDDEDDYRAGLESNLRQAGCAVSSAPSGTAALSALEKESFDIVISDIKMPGMDGVELTRRIKASQPRIPVILMTGFAEILETHEAHTLGADGFLPKPFKRDDLLVVIDDCLGLAKRQESFDDDSFCKIFIDDFISGKQIQYDIFIRLSAGKYVKIAHQGIDLSLERIRAYKAKGACYLYLRKDDFRKYVGFAFSIANKIRGDRNFPIRSRFIFAKHTSELVFEQLYSDVFDLDTFRHCRTFVENAIDVIGEDPDIAPLLEALNSHSDHLLLHSVGVSLYSVMLARSMGWISAANIFKIAVGGLLHDIGKKEFSREFLNKPRVAWNAEDYKLYEGHPGRGVEILEKIQSIPEDVLRIVKCHHESCAGTGFPAKLREPQIHPLARLVSVSNEFCRLVLKGPEGPGMPFPKAVHRLRELHSESLDPKFLQALAEMCRVDSGKDSSLHGSSRQWS